MATKSESMEDQTQSLLELPFWMEATTGVFDFLAILLVIFIAHYLSRRRVRGGFNMLISVYVAILFSLIPVALTGTELDGDQQAIAYWLSALVPSLLAVFAGIHCLRAVISLTNNENS